MQANGQASTAPNKTEPQPKSLWFEDGNVIIKCPDSVTFRVYQGILSTHSEVFRDMFLLGRPSQSETDAGVATVDVTDDSSSMLLFLTILFTPRSPPLTQNTDVSDLCVLVDLSSKYMVTFIYQEAVRCLHQIFPRSKDEFESLRDCSMPWYSGVEKLFLVISTAWRHNLPNLLPSAFLVLIGMYHWKIDSWPREDLALALRIMSVCAKAYPKLLRLKYQILDKITEMLISDHGIRPFADRPAHASCTDVIRKRFLLYTIADGSEAWAFSRCEPFESTFLFDADDDDPKPFLSDFAFELLTPFGNDDDGDGPLACNACQDVCRGWEAAAREKAWQALPGCFGLSGWSPPVDVS